MFGYSSWEHQDDSTKQEDYASVGMLNRNSGYVLARQAPEFLCHEMAKQNSPGLSPGLGSQKARPEERQKMRRV